MSNGRSCEGYATTVIQFVNGQGLTYKGRKSAPHAADGLLRTLSLSIDGSDMEKQFFCSYRRATEAGVTTHSCGVSSFWTTLAPRLGHHDEAVKHALVALGAAHHLYKMSKGMSSHLSDSSPAIGKLERFTWYEYGLAIKNLQAQIDQPNPETIVLVLVSCLSFISLELLHGDHATAIAHLRNGIRIITSVVDIPHFQSASSRPWREGSSLSELDLWEIIIQFRNIEFALGGFSSNIPLTLGQQLYRNPPFPSSTSNITSVAQGYEARIDFVNYVMVRSWEFRNHRSGKVAHAQPHILQEVSMLRECGAAIISGIESFWAGPQAPQIGTWDSYSSQMDWLLVHCARTLVQVVPFSIEFHHTIAEKPDFQDEVSRGVSFAEKMYLTHDGAGKSPSSYTLETGVIGLMYWSWVYSNRPETKAAALRVLRESGNKEGPWDASHSLRLIAGEIVPSLLVSFWRSPHTIVQP